MRLNTASKYRHFVFIYIILILMLAFDVFVVSMEGSGTLGDTNLRMGYFVIVAFLFLIYRGNPVFTYDSDGEVIILDSKNPSLRPFGKVFNQHYEFPKRKLVGYSIDKMPLRRKLSMTLSSKDGKRKRVSATMSYLNKQEVKDLERSLRGILSKNKKAGHLEEENHDA